MADDVIVRFQYIFFIKQLHWVGVVYHKRYTAPVSVVRNDAYVVRKHHNVAALPLADLVYVGSQGEGVAVKINIEVPDSAKIYIFIYDFNIIYVRMGHDILVDQLHQVIAGAQRTESYHIGTYSVLVVRISAAVINALIPGPLGNIFPGTQKYVRLVVDPVDVHIYSAHICIYSKCLTAVPGMREVVEMVQQ